MGAVVGMGLMNVIIVGTVKSCLRLHFSNVYIIQFPKTKIT